MSTSGSPPSNAEERSGATPDTPMGDDGADARHRPILASITPFLELLNEPVGAFDLDGSCIYANPVLVSVLDRDALDVVGSVSPPAWIDPQHAGLWEFTFAWCQSGRRPEHEMLSIDLDLVVGGQRVRVNVRWDLLSESDGSPACALGLVRLHPEASAAGTTSTEVMDLRQTVTDLRELITRITPRDPFMRRFEIKDVDHNLKRTADSDELCRSHLGDLSEREREVLAHLLEGKRITTIAQQLYLSEHTVRNHLKAIYRKLGLHSLAELRERLTPTGTVGA